MKRVGDLAPTRRDLLQFGGLGLALASADGLIPHAHAYATDRKSKPRGTARNVIYYEISGAISLLESFDFKENAGTWARSAASASSSSTWASFVSLPRASTPTRSSWS